MKGYDWIRSILKMMRKVSKRFMVDMNYYVVVITSLRKKSTNIFNEQTDIDNYHLTKCTKAFFYAVWLKPVCVTAVLMKQRWVDVSHMDCSSFAAHMAEMHPSGGTFQHSRPIGDAFHPWYQRSH